MSTKDRTAAILKRLEEGTAQIYELYEKRLQASAASYNKKIRDLDADYTAAANEASARARIDLKNTLEKMADSGYIRSGETVQATIAGNAAKNNALTQLAVQNAKDKTALEVEKMQTEADLSSAAQKEVSSLRNELLESARQQENWEREFQASQKQTAFENSLAEQKLALEKSASEKKSASQGIVPAKNAYEYLDDIVKRNTKSYPDKKYKVVDRSAIIKAIAAIVRDTSLSYQYRYEMYLYAKSLGYVNA